MIELRSFALDDDEVLAAWSSLLTVDPDTTVFVLPDYVRACASVGERVRRRVDVVERDGEPIGLAVLEIERQGTPTGPIEVLRFAGRRGIPAPAAPVAAPEDRHVVAAAWLEGLVEAADFDELLLAGVPADTGWPDALATAGRGLGLGVVLDVAEEHSPRLLLRDDATAPWDRRVRFDLRRRRRKLARELGTIDVRETSPRLLEDALERFLALAARDGHHPWPDETKTLLRHLGANLADDGILRLHELVVAGQALAGAVSLVGGTEWAVVGVALDPVLRRYSPEVVLVAELVHLAAAEGCTAVDLLPGVLADPARIGARDRELIRCNLVRSR